MRVDPMNWCVIRHILRFISGYSIMTQLFVAWAEQSRTGIMFPATS
jgi:hypothetical protein